MTFFGTWYLFYSFFMIWNLMAEYLFTQLLYYYIIFSFLLNFHLQRYDNDFPEKWSSKLETFFSDQCTLPSSPYRSYTDFDSGDVIQVGQSYPVTCGCGRVPKNKNDVIINCTSTGLDQDITDICKGGFVF